MVPSEFTFSDDGDLAPEWFLPYGSPPVRPRDSADDVNPEPTGSTYEFRDGKIYIDGDETSLQFVVDNDDSVAGLTDPEGNLMGFVAKENDDA
jgi:hypothetical protein